MNKNNKTEIILSLPIFRKLLVTRNRFRFVLSILVLSCNAFFVGGIAFYRDFFAQPLADNSSVTLGVMFAALVIILFIVFELIYIMVSEKVFDPLQEEAKGEVNANV